MPTDRRSFIAALAGTALAPGLGRAQTAPLRIVVPFAAGSGTDVGTRVFGEGLNKVTGRTVIVDNRAGGGTVIGSLEVIRSRPDGNTLLYTTGGHTTNAVLMKNLPFDAVNDLTPVMMMVRSSGFALLVSEKSPHRTLEQFIAAAKAKPGALTYGSSGNGNTTHVMGALFCRGTGVDLLHIPFKGTPTTELIGGTVDSAFLSPAVAAPQIRAGQLRALGISGTERSPLLPHVPTFTEAGLKVQDIPAWSGFFGPPKMSPEVLNASYEMLAKGAQTQVVRDYTRDNGSVLDLMRPEPFRAYVVSEIERYRRVLPALGIEMG